MIEKMNSPLPRWTDATIIAGIKTSDKLTLEYLYRHFKPMALRLCFSYDRPIEDADDILTVGIRHLKINIDRGLYQGKSTLSTYFFSICENICKKNARNPSGMTKYQSSKTSSEQWTDFYGSRSSFDETDIQHSGQPMEDDDYELYTKAFLKLDEKCRKIITMRGDNIEYDEIAKQLGYSNIAFAMTKKNRCKKTFMRLLENEERKGRRLFTLIQKDLNLIERFASESLDKEEVQSFVKRLDTDKAFLKEYRFVTMLNKTAKKLRNDELESELRSVLKKSEKTNIKSDGNLSGSTKPISIIEKDDGRILVSLNDLIENIRIEKSLYENDGEDIPLNTIATLEWLMEFNEGIKKGIFERFDL